MARSACSLVSTVPAPTSMSGTSATMRRMASSAAAVRKVTSAAGRPPFTRALARGTAFSASSMAMTGMMPILNICSEICTIFNVSFLMFLNMKSITNYNIQVKRSTFGGRFS